LQALSCRIIREDAETQAAQQAFSQGGERAEGSFSAFNSEAIAHFSSGIIG